MQADIVCFSHLRWNFVYQRPQHLMTRLAEDRRVFFVEEPIYDAGDTDRYDIYKEPSASVFVLTPHLPAGLGPQDIIIRQRHLLRSFLQSKDIQYYIRWYYSPMMLAFSEDLESVCTVYDCMDELSAFLFAPPELRYYESLLFQQSDIVFTGGTSLYIAKKEAHSNVHLFPSSIDKQHFVTARQGPDDPDDQSAIPWPRIGFYGVIDERMDIELLRSVAASKPQWQFVLVGPVVKIDPATLPRAINIHYLGPKTYDELPRYLAGWNIAMMPFALNNSTRFISPTKTPEYLAGGKPVISPSITDVLSPYGEKGLVHIADTPGEFIAAAEQILDKGERDGWLKAVDRFLLDLSWDRTVQEMSALIRATMLDRNYVSLKIRNNYV